MREKLKAVATWICDTEEEYEEYFTELENNSDFLDEIMSKYS